LVIFYSDNSMLFLNYFTYTTVGFALGFNIASALVNMGFVALFYKHCLVRYAVQGDIAAVIYSQMPAQAIIVQQPGAPGQPVYMAAPQQPGAPGQPVYMAAPQQPGAPGQPVYMAPQQQQVDAV
jgi:hypothetical protein